MTTHTPHSDNYTATEDALEQSGIHASRHYAMRADQLADGTYRYALEIPATGEVLAEGVHADDLHAMRIFEENLTRSGLTPDEIKGIREAADAYEASL